MKTKLFLSVSAAFLAVVLVAGCVSTNSATGGVNLKTKDVRFKSEAGSLTISNETSSDVVIFVGRVEKNAVIGGIKGDCSPITRYSTETPSAFAIFTPVSTFGSTPRASIYDKKVLLLIPVFAEISFTNNP